MIPIYRPYLPPTSMRYAFEALNSGWVSSHGKYLSMLQEKLQELLGVKHVLLVNNGTSATHLVAKALKYKHPDIYNVIVPNNVYVAAINSFVFDREFKLITTDASLETWNIDLELLEKNYLNQSQIKTGCLIVHNLGNIIDVPVLKKKHGHHMVFVEDNCEGFLGSYQNQYSGTASLVSSISFFGNKNLTSGEGGAVITNDSDVYEYLRCIHGQGQSETKFLHHHLGYNYRMTNVQAAILLGQLEIKNEIMERKNIIFDRYRAFFKNFKHFQIQQIEPNTQPANWMFGVRLLGSEESYLAIEETFKSEGIEIRPMFYPVSDHAHLKKLSYKTMFFGPETVARRLHQEVFILPSFPELTLAEQEHICSTCSKLTSFL